MDTVPCGTCGTPTPTTGTRKCNRCWEFEHRLDDYLRHASRMAIDRLLAAVANAKVRIG